MSLMPLTVAATPSSAAPADNVSAHVGNTAVMGHWESSGSTWAFVSKGKAVSGWYLVGETWYWADSAGRTATGWQYIGGQWYYFDAASAMKTGWLRSGGTWYYLKPSGAMATGWVLDNGSWYYMASSGAMTTGWLSIGSTWYYLKPSGEMAAGWAKVGSAWYYFAASGAMRTGWMQDGDAKYYLKFSGERATGWQEIGGIWYYFKSSGELVRGRAQIGSAWYYLAATTGAIQTGWVRDSGAWYYFAPSGAMATEWVKVGNSWYYMDASGMMKTGWLTLGDKVYYLASSGEKLTGWQSISDSWYHFNSDGVMTTGWLLDGSTWYHLSETGRMSTGWLQDGSTWYWLHPSSGAMATGTVVIDGQGNRFSSSGAWLGVVNAATGRTPIMGAPSGTKAAVVDRMVAAYASSHKTYPTAALKPGGAANIRTFCEILYEEAVAEGIRPELVFVQAMNETGWLQYGGDVKIAQYNFAGLGAVGGGAAGVSFKDVRTGLRAQVQHLRAYADSDVTTAKLAYPVVDPRFTLVRKGAAPYIEWLGIQENPYGSGWATAPQYGVNLVKMLNQYFG